MTFSYPDDRKEVADRARTDVQNALPESNPFLRDSFLDALIVGFSGRIYDFFIQLMILTLNMFPDTATIPAFIERWGSYKKITRNPATRASGRATLTGNAGTVIPLGTQVTSGNGLVYTSLATETTIANSFTVDSITRTGSTATVTLLDATPAISSGMEITISGAAEADYNGNFVITMTSANTFTYSVDNSPSTPATGTISAGYDGVTVSFESEGFGQDQNLSQGARLTLTSPIGGVQDDLYVQFSTIGGGTDIESDEELRDRIIDRYQNPISLFNESAIESQARSVSGVTRVFINPADTSLGTLEVSSIERFEVGGSGNDVAVVTTAVPHNLEMAQMVTIQGASDPLYNVTEARIITLSDDKFAYSVSGNPATPATASGVDGIVAVATIPPGQVEVYFMRDNDSSPIPDASEVDATKDKILEIKPATTSANDVLVRAPEGVSVDISFTSLTPNTVTIQNAITTNLNALFEDETEVSKNLTLKRIEAAILQTVDITTGQTVSDFELSSPSADVEVGIGQIPTLGNITYP